MIKSRGNLDVIMGKFIVEAVKGEHYRSSGRHR